MPGPKSRVSRSRAGMRNAHNSLKKKERRTCPTNGELHEPHKAYKASDGAYYYKGKQITHPKF
ncbi:MAG: 50S ribosomal protein L32 [Bdellovibrionales bacterium]|nr:50S ribosomal protein L32 [Bdellovibrionales bacterium]